MHVRALSVAIAIALASPAADARPVLDFQLEWTYRDGIFDGSASEIVAYDPDAQQVYVVNGARERVDVLDRNGSFQRSLSFGGFGSPNSVAVKNGVVAVAVGNGADRTQNGRVFFFNTSGAQTGVVDVGVLPDMVTFSPDGRKVLTANEGEPSGYGSSGTDPEGSISIIDISGGTAAPTVATARFTGFNRTALVAAGVRITGPGSTAAQDLEPESITVPNNTTAYVTLQENNAIAEVDLATATVTAIRPLGLKDHALPGNGLDASDRDGSINIRNWPVKGMYMPDTIASYTVGGKTYLVTANEGDGRDYPWAEGPGGSFADEIRVGNGSVSLDPTIFPNAADLKRNSNLGRLNMSRVDFGGDVPASYNEILSFGARSFTIWDAETGTLVWDSGDDFERITAALARTSSFFNSENDANSFDTRSDNKGPEPEALTIGEVAGRILAFVGLERIGGIMIYDVTDPGSPEFLTYLLNRDFTANPDSAAAGDLGPEGLYFIPRELSWTGNYGLLVANEISGTTSYYDIAVVPAPGSLALLAGGLPLLLLRRRPR
jgi:2',3'-cyclic-nucleotide 2'-phosphodiesterase / 3'-nucleotidase / 5'-nucleotidase